MTGYADTTLYNSVVLNVTNISGKKATKTIKQKLGKDLVEMKVVGMGKQQWELNISGIVMGTTSTNLDTNRSNLVALDCASAYAYVDGLHNGTYIVRPGSLNFEDSGETSHGHVKYTMSLVQQ